MLLRVCGTLLARDRRTVTSALKVLGLDQNHTWPKFHNVLNRARWDGLAVAHVRGFAEIRIAARNFSQAEQLAATNPLARPVASFEEAVRGAVVVCLSTASSTPVVEADWIVPGTHVTSVGYAPPGGELNRKLVEKGK